MGNCETLRPCAEYPCMNRGQCMDNVDFTDFSCKCQEGWKGKDCSEEITTTTMSTTTTTTTTEPTTTTTTTTTTESTTPEEATTEAVTTEKVTTEALVIEEATLYWMNNPIAMLKKPVNLGQTTEITKFQFT